MKFSTLPFSETRQFGQLFLDYIHKPEKLKDFYSFAPNLTGIEEALKHRKFEGHKREILVKELVAQYAKITASEATTQNIELLKLENTFTVTCGHQLNLFTGPLYFVYKILTTIKLANQLKGLFPDRNFVPIYWMASEDHDFAEINHFTLFGKTHTWEYEAKGAVGKIETKDMALFLESLPAEIAEFSRFYQSSETLSEATAKLVNHLFTQYGLVVLNPDVPNLRKLFVPYFVQELTESRSFTCLTETSQTLESLNYKSQVSGREINLMYSDKGLRERIVRNEEGKYTVLNTDLNFTRNEMIALAENQPENLSTNVVTRPVYQEVILPNIAFVGGPAEVVYWLQLKQVFECFDVPMPVVLPRNFALVLSAGQESKLEKQHLEVKDILLSEQELRFKIAHNDQVLDFKEEHGLLDLLEAKLLQKTETVDKSLQGTVGGEMTKIKKQIQDLEKRMEKALEKRNAEAITQILNVKTKLFPEAVPQERVDSFLNFFLNDKEFINTLYQTFEPLNFEYYLIIK